MVDGLLVIYWQFKVGEDFVFIIINFEQVFGRVISNGQRIIYIKNVLVQYVKYQDLVVVILDYLIEICFQCQKISCKWCFIYYVVNNMLKFKSGGLKIECLKKGY